MLIPVARIPLLFPCHGSRAVTPVSRTPWLFPWRGLRDYPVTRIPGYSRSTSNEFPYLYLIFLAFVNFFKILFHLFHPVPWFPGTGACFRGFSINPRFQNFQFRGVPGCPGTVPISPTTPYYFIRIKFIKFDLFCRKHVCDNHRYIVVFYSANVSSQCDFPMWQRVIRGYIGAVYRTILFPFPFILFFWFQR